MNTTEYKTMSNTIFTYNQESGVNAGAAQYISDTGAYKGEITKAEYVTSSNKGTKGIEFTFTSDDGLKANYLSAWYQKADGSQIKMGTDLINAMMGCCQLQSLTSQQVNGQNGVEYLAPEFNGKKIGLFLQKTLKSKQDGSDTYSFDIKIPFVHISGKTLKEQISNVDATTVSSMSKTMKDKDERNKQGQHQGGHLPQQSTPAIDDWDDFPQ